MRMWMTDVKDMCRKHLLGEHVELHMLVGSILKGKSLQGFLQNKLLQPQSIRSRHKELVAEMAGRGYNHKSPLPAENEYKYLVTRSTWDATVNVGDNMRELWRRCSDCRIRMAANGRRI